MRRPLLFLRAEAGLLVGAGTASLFLSYGGGWLSDLSNPWWAAGMFVWLFVSIAWLAFGVVRHADALAERLGEPYGTVILTLAVIGIEVSMIAAVSLTGKAHPELARDTMFSVVMIVMTGMFGGTLLAGGLRHHQQEYNLSGANAYLGVLVPLAVLTLIMPRFIEAAPGGRVTPLQSFFLLATSAGLYLTFLWVQTGSQASFFHHAFDEDAHKEVVAHSSAVHAALLAGTMLPVVLLAKSLGKLVDHGVHTLDAPPALGGFMVAALILSPEGLSALRAAQNNRLQRTINILLGSATSTIGMTVPVMIAISLLTGQTIELGLEPTGIVLLTLTLFSSVVTLSTGRTTLLQGVVHLILFAAYVMLIFDGS